MVVKTIEGSELLGAAIKARREELGFTINEAADLAGIGSRTWSRYEAGGSIKEENYRSIVRVLDWSAEMPSLDDEDYPAPLEGIGEEHPEWSKWLAGKFGPVTAGAFAFACEHIGDYAEQNRKTLSKMPKGTHLGQIRTAGFTAALPGQFLDRYDYGFAYAFALAVRYIRKQAAGGEAIRIRSVMEGVALKTIADDAYAYIELSDGENKMEEECPKGLYYGICGNRELEDRLYRNDSALSPDDEYHFDHWTDVRGA